MKTLLPIIVLFIVCSVTTYSQEQYTIEGKTYSLKTEVQGTLTLLWNTIDGNYRFFSKKGESIKELVNSKSDGSFQEEYKQTLQMQTSDASIPLDKVKLTRGSLRDFFNAYNSKVDPNFVVQKSDVRLKSRLGPFVGISNSIFTQNPDNINLLTAGIDFEVLEENHLVRHSLVFRLKQTFENDSYKYSATQLSLNYRFKFVRSSKVDAFINTKFAAYNYVSRDVTVTTVEEDNTTVTTIVNEKGGSFQAPVTFGIGVDYALGNGYLSFSYNDIVGLGIDSNGEFPLDFSLGYKFNL